MKTYSYIDVLLQVSYVYLILFAIYVFITVLFVTNTTVQYMNGALYKYFSSYKEI